MNRRQPFESPIFWSRTLWFANSVLGLILAMVLSGCSHLPGNRAQDKVEVKSLQAKNQKVGSTTLSALQSEVMRFADDYASTVAQTADDVAAASTNIEIKVIALRWKLEQAEAAYVNAANRNPVLNGLDMIVLATLSRMVIESQLASRTLDDSGNILLAEHRRLETNSWSVMDSVLKEEQKAELRGMLQDWRAANPHLRFVGGIRFREFAVGLGKAPEASKNKPTSIFNLLFIDPMAGLDPTARAIEETRQSAERFTYYAQRAPVLLSWQIQLLSYQLADQPAPRQLLADTERISKSAETFAHTADQIPSLVDQQREAAIRQVFDGLATERTNLLTSLASEEQKFRGLLGETRGTMIAGGEMATSIDHAIQSLHAFVRFVSPESVSNAAPPEAAAAEEKRPFNVLDYGQAATQVGAMATNLNALLGSVNDSTPRIAGLTRQAQTEAQHLVDRIFWLALCLGLIMVAAVVAAACSYRFVMARIPRLNSAATARNHGTPRS